MNDYTVERTSHANGQSIRIICRGVKIGCRFFNDLKLADAWIDKRVKKTTSLRERLGRKRND